ncbi:MAG: hypothetical protein IJT54_04485 [Candidatus Methanomethylophilaceae archaeon]|nr:hypothetical protein [Candidatus Methanomethylophilaceae archaeon]
MLDDEDYICVKKNGVIMRRFRFRNKKSKSEISESDHIAAEIMRLAQGTPIIGYHNEKGELVIPEEYDDEY